MPTTRTETMKAIEIQEQIGEVQLAGYNLVRLSRVKYKENPNTFIDIRIFQRGYDDAGEEVYYPTKKGVQLLETRFQHLIGKWTIIPTAFLHPLIVDRAFPLLVAGKFESAILQAFKSVEVAVRSAAGLKPDDIGTALMRKAFDPTRGPLSDGAVPMAEREALAHLFAGAIGFYKNPCSHRDVEMDFIQGFEMLMIASHLLKLVERPRQKV